jgi:hypothetical protein
LSIPAGFERAVADGATTGAAVELSAAVADTVAAAVAVAVAVAVSVAVAVAVGASSCPWQAMTSAKRTTFFISPS